MPSELNTAAYQQILDEDLEWLRRQPRTLERDHIECCLRWLRDNKPPVTERPSSIQVSEKHIRALTTLCYMIRDAAGRMCRSRLQNDADEYDRLIGKLNLPPERMFDVVLREVEQEMSRGK